MVRLSLLKTSTSPVDILVMAHNLLLPLEPACHLHKFIFVICSTVNILCIINVKSFGVLSIIIICCTQYHNHDRVVASGVKFW